MGASQIGKRAQSDFGVLEGAELSCFEFVEQPTAHFALLTSFSL